ncbi:MAG: hypothetical protein JOY68_04570 [Candidatus Dormibacteraeota bacterium]|nr:hypothetical protein [Candidatus Dormibacteraeota bacterium]
MAVDDTQERPAGDPGWHVREQRAAPVESWSTVPPVAPPVVPQVTSAPIAAPRRLSGMVIAGIALVLFAAVGGGALLLTSGHAPAGGAANPNVPTGPPQPVLTGALSRMQNIGYRADITITETLTLENAAGAAVGMESDSFTVHLDHESAQRSEMRETIGSNAGQRTVIVVQYDGTDYISTDNGATYQTVAAAAVQNHDLDPAVPVEFLDMVTSVDQAQSVEINGVPATDYHAVLDPVKLTNFLRGSLNAENSPLATQIAAHTGGSDGAIDAYITPAGEILSDDGSWDDAVDLGAVNAQAAGATLNANVSFQGAFTDYNGTVSVTRPVTVTGPSNLE